MLLPLQVAGSISRFYQKSIIFRQIPEEQKIPAFSAIVCLAPGRRACPGRGCDLNINCSGFLKKPPFTVRDRPRPESGTRRHRKKSGSCIKYEFRAGNVLTFTPSPKASLPLLKPFRRRKAAHFRPPRRQKAGVPLPGPFRSVAEKLLSSGSPSQKHSA